MILVLPKIQKQNLAHYCTVVFLLLLLFCCNWLFFCISFEHCFFTSFMPCTPSIIAKISLFLTLICDGIWDLQSAKMIFMLPKYENKIWFTIVLIYFYFRSVCNWFIFCISFVYWSMTSFQYCFPCKYGIVFALYRS